MAPSRSRIQGEIGQTRPFGSRAEEAFAALLRTTDRVRRVSADRIAPHGVTLQQYNVLRILRGAGEDGLPTLEIANRMMEQAPGITRLIDRLEAKRLVARQRDGADRRQVTCRITAAGRARLARLDPLVQASDALVGRSLTQRELGQLIGLLDRIRAGLDRA